MEKDDSKRQRPNRRGYRIQSSFAPKRQIKDETQFSYHTVIIRLNSSLELFDNCRPFFMFSPAKTRLQAHQPIPAGEASNPNVIMR